MLAKKYRLPVQSVLNVKGRLIRGRYLNIVVYPSVKKYVQVGVVVPIAYSDKAVARNALKRAIYDGLDWQATKMPVRSFVVRVTKVAHNADSRAILDELRQLVS